VPPLLAAHQVLKVMLHSYLTKAVMKQLAVVLQPLQRLLQTDQAEKTTQPFGASFFQIALQILLMCMKCSQQKGKCLYP